MNKPNILLFDIETSPNLAYVWGKYEQNILGDFIEEWQMLCFSYKWFGEKKVHNISRQKGVSEKELVSEIWKLFDKADIIITHNGDRFDVRKSNAKFLEYGMKPPSSYKTVDTLKVARKYFNFNSNKLNDLSTTLKIGKKVPTGGFELWLGCMRNETKAWKTMIEYCNQDVNLLEQIYLALRPWMTNHPNLNIFTGQIHGCPVCGGNHTQKRGTMITSIGKRQRYQCQNPKCGAWSSGEIIKTGIITR